MQLVKEKLIIMLSTNRAIIIDSKHLNDLINRQNSLQELKHASGTWQHMATNATIATHHYALLLSYLNEIKVQKIIIFQFCNYCPLIVNMNN